MIGYSRPSEAAQPSGSIWGDSQWVQMIDEATGFAVEQDFKAVPAGTEPGLPASADASGSFAYSSSFSSIMEMNTGSTGVAAMWARPLGAITPGSGHEYWFEAYLALSVVSTAPALFVGVSELAGLNSTIITDISTLNASTSLIGFWMESSTINSTGTMDAVYQKSGDAAPTVVLADVLNSPANNPDPGNPLFVPPTPPGDLTDAGFVKLGLRYDGKKYLYFYVNGNQVAKQQVDATFDIASEYGGIIGVEAADSTGTTALVGWFKNAAKVV
jgi:hypothetical protein